MKKNIFYAEIITNVRTCPLISRQGSSEKSMSYKSSCGGFRGREKHLQFLYAIITAIFLLTPDLFAQAQYRVDPTYEDTVRVVVIWNVSDRPEHIPQNGKVGEISKDFILKALDSSKVPNIKTFSNSDPYPTWIQVSEAFGKGRLPHVIVHSNAGFSDDNGPAINSIVQMALRNKIGIVSLGDDGIFPADVFGLGGIQNYISEYMLNAHDNTDSLWINLKRNRDDKLKVINTLNGKLLYPGVNGIISNTVDSILGGKYILPFKTHANRSGADVNAYTVLYPEKLIFLGDQQGYWEGAVIPGTDILNAIVSVRDIIETDTTTVRDTIFQDPMVSILPRRAVDLAFEPQNIFNEKASEQIVYDAIMFASLAHVTEALDTSNAGIAIVGRRKHTIKCDETVNLLATGGVTYQWSAVNPNHSDLLTKINDSTYTFTPSNKFIGDTFVYRVIANAVIHVGNNIYARKDTMFLTLNVEPITMTFGDNVTIFTGNSIKLNGSGNSSTPDIRYTWSPSNGLNNSHLQSPIASPESTTIYNVTFDDGHCRVTGAVTVTVRTPPFNNANAGIAIIGRRKHTIKCDETVSLLATGGVSYVWSAINPQHNSMIAKVNDSTYTFTPSSKFLGDTLIYRVVANVVIHVENKTYERKDTLFLTLNVEPITMTFGDDVTIFAGDPVKLNGSGNSTTPDLRYTWSPTNGQNNSHLESPVVSPESTTVYKVTYDDGHCLVTGSVTVTVRPPQVTNVKITRAVTRDTNGNGYLDAVELYFNAPVDLPTITTLFAVTHGTANFTPAGIIEKPGIEDSVLILSLREQKAGELQTGWQLQLSAGEIIIFKNSHDKFIAKWDRIVTEDGAGPVIDRAVFFPGYGELASDSLEVTLSEPLSMFSITNESPVESFSLYNKDTQLVRNAFTSATYINFDGEKKIKFRVGIRTEGKTKIIPNVDSLQFFQGSGIYRITDISGNQAPDSSIARKTLIQYNGVNRVILNVLNNPILVGRNSLDSDILRRYNHVVPPNAVGGGIFNIKTLLPLKETEGNYGEARIYDAVGNVIADRLPIRIGVQTLDYAIYWDGTNKTGRYVGQGSYQLRIRVIDIQGKTMLGKTLVGVYR